MVSKLTEKRPTDKSVLYAMGPVANGLRGEGQVIEPKYL